MRVAVFQVSAVPIEGEAKHTSKKGLYWFIVVLVKFSSGDELVWVIPFTPCDCTE